MDLELITENKRRERLRLWLAANGGPRAICVSRGLNKGVETRISNVLSGEAFGSRGARSLGRKLGMPEGHLEGVGETPSTFIAMTAPPTMSAQAADLGKLLDMLPDLITRLEVFNQCSKIIIDSLRAERVS
jgi:hypothetical protein